MALYEAFPLFNVLVLSFHRQEFAFKLPVATRWMAIKTPGIDMPGGNTI
jgi:hypothetical protein